DGQGDRQGRRARLLRRDSGASHRAALRPRRRHLDPDQPPRRRDETARRRRAARGSYLGEELCAHGRHHSTAARARRYSRVAAGRTGGPGERARGVRIIMSNSLFPSSFAPPAANAAIPPVALCPSNLPLVLLPVRLETRFFTLPSGATELRVRIYPDKIHVDTHEPELTTQERSWGTQYWQQDWTATDASARAAAWRTLAGRFGAARAAWIARVLQPVNLAQRPAAPPEFPVLPPVEDESVWRRAPQARLLPDRWIAVVHSGGQAAIVATGRDVQPGLAVGPDPKAPPPDAAAEAAILAGEKLAIDPGMAWMVDFNAAETAGMALRIAIPPAALTAGLDSLVVFGV